MISPPHHASPVTRGRKNKPDVRYAHQPQKMFSAVSKLALRGGASPQAGKIRLAEIFWQNFNSNPKL